MTHELAATHAVSGGMVPVLVYPQTKYHGLRGIRSNEIDSREGAKLRSK